MSEKEERIKEEEDQESENREKRRSKPDVNVEEEKDRIGKAEETCGPLVMTFEPPFQFEPSLWRPLLWTIHLDQSMNNTFAR